MSKMKLRHAEETDDHVIGELLIRAFDTQNSIKMPGVVSSPERYADLRDRAQKRKDATVLVGEIDGVLAGTLTLYRWGAPGNEAWIESAAGLRYLAIDPRFAGNGLSTVFIAEAKKLATDWRASAICLRVRSGASGVQRLYKLHGWKRDERGDLDLMPEIYLDGFTLRL